MNTKHIPHPESPNPINEISSLLAIAYIRQRQRHLQKHIAEICPNAEKALDDVAPSGTLRTTEKRTLEKGVERT